MYLGTGQNSPSIPYIRYRLLAQKMKLDSKDFRDLVMAFFRLIGFSLQVQSYIQFISIKAIDLFYRRERFGMEIVGRKTGLELFRFLFPSILQLHFMLSIILIFNIFIIFKGSIDYFGLRIRIEIPRSTFHLSIFLFIPFWIQLW